MTGRITCKVDDHARIRLPARWRKEHGIRPEGEVIVSFEEDKLVLQTREQAIAEAQALVRKLVAPGESLVKAVLDERRREVNREEVEIQSHLKS